MKVKVKFFALYRELVGLRETQVDLPPGSTALDVWQHFAGRHPELAPGLPHTRFAVNGDYAEEGTVLQEGDEVVFIPPVSGGQEEAPRDASRDADPFPGAPRFEITDRPIDVNAVAAAVRHDEDGAVVTFLGVVRDSNRGRQVLHLEYDAYPEMAVAKMRQIGDEIARRWGLHHAAIVHRVGRMEVGEASVAIAVAAPHRDVAFEACRYAIDRLKDIVPVWKKEVYADGEVWLANRN